MAALDVKLNVFEGPLDLLLHLIEKNKVQIFDIPIVTITDQYIEYINNMEEEDLDVMSEFLVMAATLIRIKSKMLLPKDEEVSEEDNFINILYNIVKRTVREGTAMSQKEKKKLVSIKTDDTLMETAIHGAHLFPYKLYDENITDYDFNCIDWHWHN